MYRVFCHTDEYEHLAPFLSEVPDIVLSVFKSTQQLSEVIHHEIVFVTCFNNSESSRKVLSYFSGFNDVAIVMALVPTDTKKNVHQLELAAIELGAFDAVTVMLSNPLESAQLVAHAIQKNIIRKRNTVDSTSLEELFTWQQNNQPSEQEISLQDSAEFQDLSLSSEENFTQEFGRIGTWEFKVDSQEIFMSPSLLTIYNRSIKEGNPTFDELLNRYHPHDKEKLTLAIERSLQTKRPFSFRLSICENNLPIKYIEGVARIIIGRDGKVKQINGISHDTTSNTLLFKRMQTSLKLIENVAENVGTMICRYRYTDIGSFRFVFVNSAVEKIFEVSVEEALTNPYAIANQIDEKDVLAIRELFVNEIAQKEKIEYTLTIRTPSNTTKYVRMISEPHRISNSIIEYDSLLIDITQEYKTQEQLKISESRFRGLIEKNYDAFSITTPEGIIKYVSPSIFSMMGYQPDEFLNQQVIEYVHPEDRELVMHQIGLLLSGEVNSFSIKHRLQHKDGHFFWIQDTISNHLETEGIWGLVSNFHNINQEEKYREQLEMNKVRFDYLSKATRDVVWDLDVVKGTYTWGEHFSKLFNDHPENYPTSEDFAALVSEDENMQILEDFNAFIEGKETYWKSFYTVVKKDGTTAEVIDQGYALRDKNGKAYRIIGAIHDISAELDYRNKIRLSESRFSKLFENAPIGLLKIDTVTGKIIRTNPIFISYSGYSPSELKNMTIHDLAQPGEKNKYQKTLDNIEKLGSFGPENMEFRQKDGNPLFVLISGFFQRAEDTTLNNCIWLYVLDISELIFKNKALVESENKFHQYLRNTSDLFAVVNMDHELSYISSNVESVLGYKPSALENRNVYDLVHHKDHSLLKETLSDSLENLGDSYRLMFRAKDINGSYRYLEANGYFTLNNAGEHETYMVIRDIDEEVKKNRQIERLSLVADRTTNAITVTNANDEITWVNNGFVEMTGYTLELAEGLKPAELLRSSKTSKKQAAQIDQLAAEKLPFKAEILNKRKDGQHFWVEIFVTPLFDNHGKFTGYINIQNDITDRILQNKELKKTLDFSQNQAKRLQNFAHIVSHNFRSHAANIYQLTQALKQDPPEEIRVQMRDYLFKSANDLLTALNELNEVLQIQENTNLELVTLNLKEYVEKVESLLHRQIEEHEVTILCDFPSDFCIHYFPAYLESVVYNLISNSIRYRSPERKPIITISAKKSGKSDYFSVSDNGLGIDLKLHGKKMFKMRKVFHNHPDSKGMGLFIVKNQLEALGGSIAVQSTEGEGTTFTVKLPAKK